MLRRIRGAATALLPAVLGLSLFTPAPASAEVVTAGNLTAYFNYPTPNGAYDTTISDGAAGLIDLADSGTIRMGMFWLNSATIQDKLIAAQARGVTVKVVVEGRVMAMQKANGSSLIGDGRRLDQPLTAAPLSFSRAAV